MVLAVPVCAELGVPVGERVSAELSVPVTELVRDELREPVCVRLPVCEELSDPVCVDEAELVSVWLAVFVLLGLAVAELVELLEDVAL